MFETLHKKTKSMDSKNLNKSKYFDKKKELSMSSLNITMMKSNLLSTSRRNMSQYGYEDLKQKYIFDDDSLNSEDFKHDSDMVMADYKYDSLNVKHSDNFDKLVEKDFNNILSTNRNFIRHNHLPLLESINNESQLKVCINVQDFNNPIKAFSTIKKNKIIHESMVQNYYLVQKKKYDDYKNKIEHLEKIYNTTNYRKIKVTTIVPKNHNIEHMNINNTNNSNNNDKKEQQNQVHIGSLRKGMDYLEMYAYYVYSYKLFPEGREQFSFSYDNSDAIVYGGLITNKSNKIWKLDPSTLTWSVLDFDTQSINVRSGHSGVLYQKKLYLFGGRSKLQNFYFIQDLEIFDLEDKTWSSPNAHTKSALKLRRNHVGLLIGQQMFVHGGISEDDEYLDDCHLLNFYPLKWNHCTINLDCKAPLLAWHSACFVMPFDIAFHPKFNIYKIPEIGMGRRVISRIKEKGIYLFGGKSSEDCGLHNDLWILRIGKKPLEWFKPETNGSPPCPRYSHSMNFYEEGNYLIIHGGRNDYSSESFALNDTYLLELHRLEWIKVKVFFDSPLTKVFSRCGHSAIVFTNKLILFGGMNNLNYIGASVFVIDLDSHANPHLYYNHEYTIENFFKKNFKMDNKMDKKKRRETMSMVKRQILISNSNSQLPPIK